MYESRSFRYSTGWLLSQHGCGNLSVMLCTSESVVQEQPYRYDVLCFISLRVLLWMACCRSSTLAIQLITFTCNWPNSIISKLSQFPTSTKDSSIVSTVIVWSTSSVVVCDVSVVEAWRVMDYWSNAIREFKQHWWWSRTRDRCVALSHVMTHRLSQRCTCQCRRQDLNVHHIGNINGVNGNPSSCDSTDPLQWGTILQSLLGNRSQKVMQYSIGKSKTRRESYYNYSMLLKQRMLLSCWPVWIL